MKKNLIIFLIIIFIAIISIATYFINTKSQKENFNNQKEGNLETLYQNSEIKIVFDDGYKEIKHKDNNFTIYFGPIVGPSKTFGPFAEAKDIKKHAYSLTTKPPVFENQLINKINTELGPTGMILSGPKTKMIDNYQIVEWIMGGAEDGCEWRHLELIGQKHNYHLMSDGCHYDQQFDLNYFDKVIKKIELF